MASIRRLKKDINYLAYELLTEVFTYKHFHPELEERKYNEIIKKIILLRSELILRVNHTDDEKTSDLKKHFQRIREDMVKMIEVLHELTK